MPAPIKNMQSFLKPRCLLTRDGDENFISVEFLFSSCSFLILDRLYFVRILIYGLRLRWIIEQVSFLFELYRCIIDESVEYRLCINNLSRFSAKKMVTR